MSAAWGPDFTFTLQGEGRPHRRTGRHFTGGAEKICLENNNLP